MSMIDNVEVHHNVVYKVFLQLVQHNLYDDELMASAITSALENWITALIDARLQSAAQRHADSLSSEDDS